MITFIFGSPRQDPVIPLYYFPEPKELYRPGPEQSAVQIYGPTPSTRAKAFYTPSTYPPGTYVPSTYEPIPYTPGIYKPAEYAPGIYPARIHLPAGTKPLPSKPLTQTQKEALRAELARLTEIADARAVENFILSLAVEHPEEIINAKDSYSKEPFFSLLIMQQQKSL